MFKDILWTIYLGMLGTASIGFLIKRKYKTVKSKLDFIISIFTWLGLFGYVTGIQLFTPIVWKVVFVVGLLWDVVYTIFLYDDSDYEEELPVPARIVGLVVLVPLYYGLYHYAFS
jgi:hypothetical protein